MFHGYKKKLFQRTLMTFPTVSQNAVQFNSGCSQVGLLGDLDIIRAVTSAELDRQPEGSPKILLTNRHFQWGNASKPSTLNFPKTIYQFHRTPFKLLLTSRECFVWACSVPVDSVVTAESPFNTC
ncbi:hypothetical protein RUM44_009395 [Polyplax serrata]|uniref:Uncharacterized protein n=1 Tax=Polyplax serrata TaxID=468196 RepID=A0ABR1AU24_POLSC